MDISGGSRKGASGSRSDPANPVDCGSPAPRVNSSGSSGPADPVGPIGRSGAHVPLSQFGLGFWQAWWTLTFCTDTLVGSGSQYALAVDIQTLLFAITTLGYLVTLLMSRSRTGRPFGRGARLAAGALCCAGSLGMAAATYLLPAASASGTGVFLVSSVLFSVGDALLISLWGELWGALASGKVGRCLYMSYIIAFAAYFVLQPLPLAVRAVVLAVLPVVSCFILSVSQSEPKRSPRKAVVAQPLPRHLIPCALAATFLLNFVWGAGLPALDMLESVSGQLTSSVGIAIALVLLVCLFGYMVVAQPEVEAFSLHAPVGVALAGGMLLAMLLPAGATWLGEGVMILGGACLDTLVMLGATDIAFRTKRSAAFVLSLTMLVARLGSLAGRIIYDALLIPGVLAPDQVLLACVLVVVVCGFVVFTRSSLEAFYRTAPVPQDVHSLEEGCATFVLAHGLTSREAEVLTYLVRGRSAPFIAEKLSIAVGTAKNHVSNIYRKVGVGDRQSLLNLIEQEGMPSNQEETRGF